MNIQVKMTRKENTARYGAGVVSLDLEEYLCGVVPAEMYDSAPMDALKAQAIAARTYAAKRAMAGTVIDDTSRCQAYRVSLAEKSPNSRQAIAETKGLVLLHDGEIIDCFYSASNGGVTKRSGDVWSKHYPYYVSKADAWDVEANRERPTKASHGIGMSQIGAMWAAKQGVSFADILAFYYEDNALAVLAADGSVVPLGEEAAQGVPPTIQIIQRFMTRNDCYTANRKIEPKGIMVHSTAAPGVMAAAWFDRWNRSYKAGETTRQVCVHAFLDDKEVWQYLPWDHRGWHAGGTANNGYIGFEICEPSGHKYGSGGTMINYDPQKNEAYFRAIWHIATTLCAMLCRMFRLDPMNIIGHYEGHKMGMASNHADPKQWFPKHGESMDTFRAAVKERLDMGDVPVPTPVQPPAPSPEPADGASAYALYTVRAKDTLWGIAREHLGAGTRYTEIMRINGLKSDTIREGQALRIPKE